MTRIAEPSFAVIFDLDGVLTDTAELHFQSWLDLARELDVPFDRAANEALRGLSRPESLLRFLGNAAERFTPDEQAQIMARKNERYLERVRALGPGDALPGAHELLLALRKENVPLAVASSSRNAETVLTRLQLMGIFDAVVDGNAVPHSKPDPTVFQEAARRLGFEPGRCVVVEDAESGVAGAQAAGMRVIGIGPGHRVGAADLVVESIAQIRTSTIRWLVAGT